MKQKNKTKTPKFNGSLLGCCKNDAGEVSVFRGRLDKQDCFMVKLKNKANNTETKIGLSDLSFRGLVAVGVSALNFLDAKLPPQCQHDFVYHGDGFGVCWKCQRKEPWRVK